jgi:hypothetical protein
MKRKAKKELGEMTRASVKKEMAKPRMAKSAREEEANRIDARRPPVKRGKAKLQLQPLPVLGRAW